MSITELKTLDDLNNERVETTKKRVAHVISILKSNDYNREQLEDYENDNIVCEECLVKDVARCITLLEAAEEEMRWSCKHFEWNDDICDMINDSCVKLGKFLCDAIYHKCDRHPSEYAFYLKEAEVILSKVLGSLVMWNEEYSVSDV